MVNGMSNLYYGWGGEDDEFRYQILKFNIKINRPENITTGKFETFRKTHRKGRKRDQKRCLGQEFQYKTVRRRDPNDGLNSTRFNIAAIREPVIDGSKITILNIELICDKMDTPWCECNEERT